MPGICGHRVFFHSLTCRMQGVERLRGIVMQHAVPRRLRHGAISATDGSAPGSSGSGGSGGGGVMTGPVLAGLIEAYVEAINAGAMPSITTMWQVSKVHMVYGVHCVHHAAGEAGVHRAGHSLAPLHS